MQEIVTGFRRGFFTGGRDHAEIEKRSRISGNAPPRQIYGTCSRRVSFTGPRANANKHADRCTGER
jgi:hypothetical protein